MERSTAGRVARAYLASIAIWSALSLLTGWNYLIFDQSANLKSTLTQMILLAEARGLAYALLTPPIFYIVRRYTLGAPGSLRYLGAYILGGVPFLLVCATVRWTILPSWNVQEQRFESHASSSPLQMVHQGFADMVTIYIAIVVAGHAYNYLERIRKQELERSEFQQALAASELHALKMQLHPHFLFNTLHGISTLIDSNGKSAKEMILKLSNLLRISLEHSGSDLIPLADELKFIGEYLDIEQMRFGSRLAVTWSIDPVTLRALVPQLILQPLVENAIRHGVAASRENSWINISSKATESGVELLISNSVGAGSVGAGNMGLARPGGSGLGLRNTQARLKHLYAGESTFTFAVNGDQTATSMLVLPTLGRPMHPAHPAVEDPEKKAEDYAGIDYRR